MFPLKFSGSYFCDCYDDSYILLLLLFLLKLPLLFSFVCSAPNPYSSKRFLTIRKPVVAPMVS